MLTSTRHFMLDFFLSNQEGQEAPTISW